VRLGAFALIGASTLFFSFLDIGLIYAIFGAILRGITIFCVHTILGIFYYETGEALKS